MKMVNGRYRKYTEINTTDTRYFSQVTAAKPAQKILMDTPGQPETNMVNITMTMDILILEYHLSFASERAI